MKMYVGEHNLGGGGNRQVSSHYGRQNIFRIISKHKNRILEELLVFEL